MEEKARMRTASSKRVSAKKRPRTAGKAEKYVYTFGGGKAEGKAEMKNLLGGKGANLAEMANIGLPVPPGFTITTDVCVHYYRNRNAYPKGLDAQVRAAMAFLERVMASRFGDRDQPFVPAHAAPCRA